MFYLSISVLWCCGAAVLWCCGAGTGTSQVSPLAFLTLGEQGLDTLTVAWQSALNSALFRVPDRLLVLLAASQDPHGPNLYLQSPERKHTMCLEVKSHNVSYLINN